MSAPWSGTPGCRRRSPPRCRCWWARWPASRSARCARSASSSEALLLLFAPGLFVGLTPLLTAKYLAAAAAVRFAEISLVTPMLLSVPAVFVFTFVFAGLRRAWVRDRAARVQVLLTGLSTVLLVAVLSWVVQAQTVTWNLVVAANSSRVAGPLLLGRLRAGDPLAPLPQQLATPAAAADHAGRAGRFRDRGPRSTRAAGRAGA